MLEVAFPVSVDEKDQTRRYEKQADEDEKNHDIHDNLLPARR